MWHRALNDPFLVLCNSKKTNSCLSVGRGLLSAVGFYLGGQNHLSSYWLYGKLGFIIFVPEQPTIGGYTGLVKSLHPDKMNIRHQPPPYHLPVLHVAAKSISTEPENMTYVGPLISLKMQIEMLVTRIIANSTTRCKFHWPISKSYENNIVHFIHHVGEDL